MKSILHASLVSVFFHPYSAKIYATTELLLEPSITRITMYFENHVKFMGQGKIQRVMAAYARYSPFHGHWEYHLLASSRSDHVDGV